MNNKKYTIVPQINNTVGRNILHFSCSFNNLIQGKIKENNAGYAHGYAYSNQHTSY